MNPICLSGNCTWPVFRSAGWCSKCEDITSDATFAGCDVGMPNSSSHDYQVFPCNITLPDGNWINSDIEGAWRSPRTWEAIYGGDNPEPRFTIKMPWFGVHHVNNQWGQHLNRIILGVKNPLSAVAFVKIDTPSSNGE